MGVFNVSSKINLNFGKLRELDRNTQKALEMTTDALLTEVKNAEVMPFDTGNLQNESTFADYSNSDKGVTSIVSTTPYARRLRLCQTASLFTHLRFKTQAVGL